MNMIGWHSCLAILYSIHSVHFGSAEDLYEGDKCSIAGSPGECKKIDNCSIAIEAIHKRPNQIQLCGFERLTPIVCCPSLVPKYQPKFVFHRHTSSMKNKTKTFKRKSAKACDVFSEFQRTRRSIIDFYILGGRDARMNEYPHMVALGFKRSEGWSYDCGASVISNRFLLTAAHCLNNEIPPTKARMGVTLLNDTSHIDITIRKGTMHPLYDSTTKLHDIAVVELAKTITFTNKVRPACLYSSDDDPPNLITIGWGLTISNAGITNHLQKAELMPVSTSSCNTTYYTRTSGNRIIQTTQVCAKGIESRADSCKGDSGGPLQIKENSGMYTIVGVVSYGGGCGGVSPTVSTRVSQYLGWIESIVWK